MVNGQMSKASNGGPPPPPRALAEINTRLEMYLIGAEDLKLEPSDLDSQFSICCMVLLPESPRSEESLQETVEVLFPKRNTRRQTSKRNTKIEREKKVSDKSRSVLR